MKRNAAWFLCNNYGTFLVRYTMYVRTSRLNTNTIITASSYLATKSDPIYSIGYSFIDNRK